MIIYEESFLKSTKKLLELISDSKVAGYKVNIPKLVVFLYANHEHLPQNEILRYKSNKMLVTSI